MIRKEELNDYENMANMVMQQAITEFHVSPWVLPKETMLGWVKWNLDENVNEVVISTQPNVVFKDIFSYNGEVSSAKGVAHRPLDFEEVFSYNRSIFIAMMFAGMFDAYFTTLIKKGIKGLEKLASQNSAFLYPAYFIWMIENFAKRLDDKGYQILQKILDGATLDRLESDYVKGISIGDYKVALEDEQGCGLTFLGYAVLVRHKRGQSHIAITQ
jgi:hypothetical protein